MGNKQMKVVYYLLTQTAVLNIKRLLFKLCCQKQRNKKFKIWIEIWIRNSTMIVKQWIGK